MKDAYTNYPRTILWLVRGGEGTIGGGEPEAQPALTVALEPFYISKLPISNEQYEAYEPHFSRSSSSPGDRDPAVGVSYHDAIGYAAWYGKIARKTFRLPTELEWEYAARAGGEGRYFFEDDEDPDEFIYHAGNSGETIPNLEACKPNGFGLFAMLGGVWEWTGSVYQPYPLEPDHTGQDDRDAPRVLRGASYRCRLAEISCSVRRPADPHTRSPDLGFRLVKSFR